MTRALNAQAHKKRGGPQTVSHTYCQECFDRPASVGIAAVDRAVSLLDDGCNFHLEQYLAVVV